MSLFASVRAYLKHLLFVKLIFVGTVLVGFLFAGNSVWLNADTGSPTEDTAFDQALRSVVQKIKRRETVNLGDYSHLPDGFTRILDAFVQHFSEFNDANFQYKTALKPFQNGNFISVRLASATEQPPELENAQMALRRFELAADNYYAAFPRRIEALDIPVVAKTRFLKGFASTSGELRKHYAAYIDNQTRILHTYEELFRVCISDVTVYDEASQIMIFEKQDNLDEYNNLMTTLLALSKEQHDIAQSISIGY